MSPREAPSDRPEKHLPPARIFSKAKRRTGQFRPRPTLVNAHESPSQKRALLPAQDPCRGRRDRPPRPASLRRLHPHHRPKEEGASAGDGRPGPGIRKCSEAGWCPLSSPRAPAPPQPDSRRPLSAARGAPYLCVELGRGHGGPAAPTPPACAEAAPRLGGRPRRLGSAQAAAGGKQGRAGGAGRLRRGRPAGASPSLPGSPRAATSAPRARDPRSLRAAPRRRVMLPPPPPPPCALWEREEAAPARSPRLLRALSSSRCLPSAVGSEHQQRASPRCPRTLAGSASPQGRVAPRTPPTRSEPWPVQNRPSERGGGSWCH